MPPWGFEKFVKDWIDKAESYRDMGDLRQVFDKFISLYVAYNAIYAEVQRMMLEDGKIKEKHCGDKMAAVYHISKYLGYNELADEFRKHNNELDEIKSIIRSHDFILHSRGADRLDLRKKDEALLKEIESEQSESFSEAVLLAIYLTRCNLFHGAKAYVDDQERVLLPMSTMLRTVIDLALPKLHRETA